MFCSAADDSGLSFQEREGRMKRLLLLAVVSLVSALSVAAQTPGPVAKIYYVKVKPGMEAQFEEAYKAHIEWHRSQNDTWVWDAWQFESGTRFGQYAVVTPGHSWADFDARGEMDAADNADAQKRLLPLMESLEVSYSRIVPEISQTPGGMEKVAVAEVVDFHIRPGKEFDFLGVIRKVNEAMKGEEGGPSFWTRSLTGPGTVFTAISTHPDWASLEPRGKPPIAVLPGKIGALETAALVKTFSESVESTETSLVRYREDLSYSPKAP